MDAVLLSYLLMLSFTVFSFLISKASEGRLILPVLNTLSVYLPFLLEIQKGFWHAFFLLCGWSAFQSILTIVLAIRKPDVWASRIWKAESYTESMFHWIRTGELPEGNRVLRVHLKQLVTFCLLAFLTLNFGALLLGCLLLNYMNYYVAQLVRSTRRKRSAMLIGWNPWSVIRVLSFLYLSVACSSFSLWFLFPIRYDPSLWLMAPGLIGALADIVLKIKLSEAWSNKIRALLDSPK